MNQTTTGKLSLSLAKPGEDLTGHGEKLSLNLAKPAKFHVELYWNSEDDLDAHALLATNDGNGARVSSFGQVLSTYNCKKTNPNGHLDANPNGSFSTPEGALTHSGDCRNGLTEDVDEAVVIDGSKIPAGVNEIPIFVTIHPSGTKQFSAVKEAGIRIKDDSGNVLEDNTLNGKEFGEFDAVQMGSLMLDNNGWHYAKVGVGIKGDFNTVLGYFS